MKKVLILTITLSFLLINLGKAQTIPQISVNAPATVERDEDFIQISLTVENEKKLTGTKLRHTWTILEDGKQRRNVLMFDNGKTVIVPTKRTNLVKYSVMSDYIYEVKEKLRVLDKAGKPIEDAKVYVGESKTPIIDMTVDTKNVQSQMISGEISIVGEVVPVPPGPTPVPPGPGPNPNPPTPPPLPAGEFGLAQVAYDLVMAKVSPLDRAKSAALATSYDNIAAKISASQSKLAAGVALGPEDLKLDDKSILTALKQSNGKVLEGAIGGWQTWDTAYGDYVYKLYTDGKIKTAGDWMKVFKETADGLEVIRPSSFNMNWRR